MVFNSANPAPVASVSNSPPALLIGAATHVGQRRTRNEDSFCIADASLATSENTSSGALRTDPSSGLNWHKGSLLVLTDGVGGLGAGEIAAQTSARVAYQSYYAHKTEADGDAAIEVATESSLRHSIVVAHESVRRLTQPHSPAESASAPKVGMASTLVMAVIHPRHVSVANVGDSRCYLLRAGQLQQLSTDHSWVAEQVRAGLISPENAAKHDYRNVLSQSVGATDAPPNPALAQHDWSEHDRLLLCSDGLWGQLSAGQLTALLSEGDDPQIIANRLIAAANAAGGSDNITAIVAFNHAAPAPRRAFKWGWAALPVLLLGVGLGLMAIRNAASSPAPDATSATRPAQTATHNSPALAAAATLMPVFTSSPDPDSQPTATRVAQAMPATAAPVLAPASASDMVFCRSVRAGRCTQPETVFNPYARLVYGVWPLDVVRAADTVVITWFRNGELVDSQLCTLRSVGNSVRCAERGVLPTQANISSRQSGQYRLQILIAERPVLTGDFTVK